MEVLTTCPVCGNQEIEQFLEGRDYFLTGKDFGIFSCRHCAVKFTNPRPSPEEIGGYYQSQDYISHDTSKKGLFTALYSAARNISLGRKVNLVKDNSAGNELLDVGCGTGEFLNRARREGFIVKGIEPNPKAAGFAGSHYGLDIFPEEELHKFPSGSFDVITLWHVLEHVHDPNERMRTLYRILKDTGTLIIAVPNATAPDSGYYGKYWAAYDLPRHLFHFSKESISFLASGNYFRMVQILPMKMDAYYISLLSEKYMSGKSRLVRAFLNGMSSNFSASRDLNYSSLIFIMKKEPLP